LTEILYGYGTSPRPGHPIVLASGEGFVIRVGTTQGATVAVKSVFVVEWVELVSY